MGLNLIRDERLFCDAQAGNRQAFAELVRRYQNLVASIAYSGTGNLDQSEEIAQQTFVTAWEKRATLRDPARTIAWLAGIARNLTRQHRRSAARQPTLDAETIESVAEPAQSPIEHCIDREQQELLWSALREIPDAYREPLILFHREHQSVAEVARQLALSEDAVKQRLSRGRSLLKREVSRFVEEALSTSRPDGSFVAGVMAALPPAGTTVGATTASVAGAKWVAKLGALKALLGWGTLIGFGGGALGTWRALRAATSRVERRFIWRGTIVAFALPLLMMSIFGLARQTWPLGWPHRGIQTALWIAYGASLVGLVLWFHRRQATIKRQFGSEAEREALREHGNLPMTDTSFRAQALVASVLYIGVCALLAASAGDWLGATVLAILLPLACGGLYRYVCRVQTPRLQWVVLRRGILLGGILGAWVVLARWDVWASQLTLVHLGALRGAGLALCVLGLNVLIYLSQTFQTLRPVMAERTVVPEPRGVFHMKFLIPALVLTVLVASGLFVRSGSTPANTWTLDNGLTVVVQPIAGAQQTSVLTLFDVGELHDPTQASGLAHLIEHLYVTAATAHSPARTAQEAMQAYPLGWNAQTGSDYTVVASVVPPEQLQRELEDAAARMGALDIEQSDLDREITRIEQEVHNMFEAMPRLVGRNVARHRLHPRPHGGRHGGLPDHIRRLRLEQVRSHWQRFYKPRNATLVVAGKVELDQVEPWIKTCFEGISTGEPLPPLPPLPPKQPGRVEKQLARNPTPSVTVAYATPAPTDPDYPAFLAWTAQLQAAAMSGTPDPRSFPVTFAILDDPECLYLWRPIAKGESETAAISAVEDMLPDVAPRNAGAIARQQFRMLLGLDGYGSMWSQNVYGAAFSLGRCRQLGIEAERLSDQLKGLTPESLAACRQRIFDASSRVVVVER